MHSPIKWADPNPEVFHKEREHLLNENAVLKDELRRAKKGFDLVLHAVTHDFEEEFRSIDFYAKKLRSKNNIDKEVGLDQIGNSAIKLRSMISDVQMFTQLDRIKIINKPVDLNKIFQDIFLKYGAEIEKARATFKLPDLPFVVGNRRELHLLFEYLIQNCLKFHGNQALQVAISVRQRKEHWLFTISDNGIGIALNNLHLIFDLFYAIHPDNSYQGNGSGLAICKKIVERHKGSIWTESGEGEGASIHFTIKKTSLLEYLNND